MNFVLVGALSALLAVLAGAFGAHALRERIAPELLQAFETGARYQMYHALAMIALGLGWARLGAGRDVAAAGWLFAAGTLFFSGSLYAMALSGARLLGAVTPLGGLCFIAGWVCVARAAWGTSRRS